MLTNMTVVIRHVYTGAVGWAVMGRDVDWAAEESVIRLQNK